MFGLLNRTFLRKCPFFLPPPSWEPSIEFEIVYQVEILYLCCEILFSSMHHQSSKAYTIIGVCFLMTALFFIFKFGLNVTTQHLDKDGVQVFLSSIVCVLTFYSLSHIVREKEIEGSGYRFWGDFFIQILPFIALVASASIDNRLSWLCAMTAFIGIQACLAMGHDHAVDAAVKRKEEKKERASPFLSGILISNMQREQLLRIVESMRSFDKDETTIMRVSSLGKDEWVLSFPQGVSIDSFLDTILGVCLDIDDKNHIEYSSGNHNVVGYYQFVEGPMDGKLLMFTCEEEYEFKIIDSQGTCYKDTSPRKRHLRILRKKKARFTPTDNNGLVFIPVNLKDIINKGSVIKQVRISNLT